MAMQNCKKIAQLMIVGMLFTFITSGITEAKTIKLRLATGAKPVQRFYQTVEKWAKLVEERTNQGVKIKIFHSGQLYHYHQLADPLMNGDIDLALGSPGTFGKLAPSSSLTWIGWEMETEAQGWKALQTLVEHPEFTATINGRLEELGAKLLFYSPLSVVKGPLTVDKPIRTIEDLKGLLVYAPAPSIAEDVKVLGGKPVFVPTGEVYSALQLGTFQGLMSQQELYFAFKLFEQTKYMTDYVFNGGMMPFFISMKTWNRLPENIQIIMTNAAREMQADSFKSQVEFDNFLLSKLDEKLEIISLSPEEKERWSKVLLESHEKEAALNERTQKIWKLWNKIKENQ